MKASSKFILLLILFATAAKFASATNWYVRTDGGDEVQCTGKANAPYSGSGSAQACAFKNPMYLWLDSNDNNASSWKVAQSDNIYFEDQGPYYEGQQTNGQGIYWPACGTDLTSCPTPPRNLPGGTALAPMHIYGANAGNCHNSDHTALTNPTRLVGIGSLFLMLSLQDTNYVDVECLDFSSANPCNTVAVAVLAITNTQMTAGTATYTYTVGSGSAPFNGNIMTVKGTTNGGGVFNVVGKTISNVTSTTFQITGLSGTYASAAEAGLPNTIAVPVGQCSNAGTTYSYATKGIEMMYDLGHQGPSNSILKDIATHGMAGSGIIGSKYNRTPSDTMAFDTIIISGNGLDGMDADAGGCGTSCESQGTINASYITATWNGCIEVPTNGGPIGSNGYNWCIDQGAAAVGNGDGLVMIATGGTWNWNHVTTEYNGQDGFDSLHTSDDPANEPTININDVYSLGNEGQSIKGGGLNVTLTNSVGISNCNVFNTGSFPLNPVGWNMYSLMRCRANDGMAFLMAPGGTLTVQYVDNISEQNVTWDISVVGAPASCPTCKMIFQNNVTMGFISPVYGTYPAGLYYEQGDFLSNTGSSATNNAWYHMGNSGTVCPSDSLETAYQCGSPQFTAQAAINSMNLIPLAHASPASSLIANGVAISGITTDINGLLRPVPSTIGAYEFAIIPTTYYLSPSGSDSNSGLMSSLPWLTPNHAINCGDTIIAASGSYSATTFANGDWGTVACSGHGVAWLQCATFDTCKIAVSSGNADAMDITASHWGVSGWEVTNTSGSTSNANGFEIFPPSSSSLTDIIIANSICNVAGGGCFASRSNGTAGVDYVAFVGDVSYNAGSTNTYYTAGFSIGSPVAFDTLPGTHIYVGGNWSIGTTNPSGGFDGEGFILDTIDGGSTMPTAYAQQIVVDNNMALGNGGSGIFAELNQNNTTVPAGPYAQIYLRNNTTWNNATGTNLAGSTIQGEFVLYKTQNTTLIGNLGQANTGGIGGVSGNPSYATLAQNVDGSSFVFTNNPYSAGGHYTSAVSATGFSFGDNATTNPTFANPTQPSAPSCSAFSNVPACMATVIANFIPINSAMGRQPIKSYPIYDPLFPKWLCNVNLPSGLVTMGCLNGTFRGVHH